MGEIAGPGFHPDGGQQAARTGTRLPR